MLLRVALVLAVSLLGGAAHAQTLPPEQRTCSLKIVMLTGYSSKPVPFRVDSFIGKMGLNLAARFKDGLATGLACGTYSYGLQPYDLPGQCGFERNTINLQDTHQQLTLEVDDNAQPDGCIAIEYARTDRFVRSRIRGPVPADAWIRLMSVSSGHYRDILPNADGTFDVHNPESGQHVVLVLQADKLLTSALWLMKGSSTQPIELTVPDR